MVDPDKCMPLYVQTSSINCEAWAVAQMLRRMASGVVIPLADWLDSR
jgi:hypothetical protein